jgi:uncharacterized membrane protein
MEHPRCRRQPDVALSGMLVTGAVPLTVLVLVTSTPPIESFAGWYLILATGICAMAPTLLLYAGLSRGPIGMVAPVVGAYPAFNILIGLAAGILPTGSQWIAILAVMGGGRGGRAVRARTGRRCRRRPARYAGDRLAGGTGLRVRDQCRTGRGPSAWRTHRHGGGAVGERGRHARLGPSPPGARGLALAGRCSEDARRAGLCCAIPAAHGPGSIVATVVASSFAAVNVVLARFVLKEPMSLAQWAGIAMIVLGVGALSALRP